MSDVLIDRPELDGLGVYEFGWHDEDAAGAIAKRGISEDVVRGISGLKNEPEWMLKTRLKGYQLFGRKPMPTWGADLSEIDFDNIKYFVRSTEKQNGRHLKTRPRTSGQHHSWVPAERSRLVSGVASSTESSGLPPRSYEDLSFRGVIFRQSTLQTRNTLRSSPGVLAPVIPVRQQAHSLNTAVVWWWCGVGLSLSSPVHVPKGTTRSRRSVLPHHD